MTIDLVMGAVSTLIGLALLARNTPLAALMKEGDERYRGHPWLRAFEPSDGPLATDAGRLAAFRAWLVASSAAFLAVGLALAVRGVLGL